MALMPGFEPGPHWWEASAVTTVPSLAPPRVYKVLIIIIIIIIIIMIITNIYTG